MKGSRLVITAAFLGTLFLTTAASAFTDERPLTGTMQLQQSGREITVDGRREGPRRGEVEVDGTVTRAGRDLVVNTNRSAVRILASSRVPVYYNGRTYRVSNLEVGDRIRVIGRITRDRAVEARWIGVVSSISDRRYDRRYQRDEVITGVVTTIDHRRETLRLRTQNGRTVVVDADDVSRRGSEVRFDRLRPGDRITVVGRFTSSNAFRAELIRIPGPYRGRDDREQWREGRRY